MGELAAESVGAVAGIPEVLAPPVLGGHPDPAVDQGLCENQILEAMGELTFFIVRAEPSLGIVLAHLRLVFRGLSTIRKLWKLILVVGVFVFARRHTVFIVGGLTESLLDALLLHVLHGSVVSVCSFLLKHFNLFINIYQIRTF